MPAGRTEFRDIHFTREFKKTFISSLSDPIKKAIICSPFFDKLPAPFSDIFGFCIFLLRRGTEQIEIITRPPGSNQQALSVDMAKRLAAEGIEIYVRQTPYLHAKLYHFEYEKGYFRTFLGSANFTMGGFVNNHELVAELQGTGDASASHREIARMQMAPAALTFSAWINKGLPKGPENVE